MRKWTIILWGFISLNGAAQKNAVPLVLLRETNLNKFNMSINFFT